MNSTNQINSSQKQNTSGSSLPFYKKLGRHDLCRIEKITWAAGLVLLITGLALFVLNTLYAHNFVIAAGVTTGTGGLLFLSGFCTHCVCTMMPGDRGAKFKGAAGKSKAQGSSTSANQALPTLPKETKIRDFFESKGLFGVPEDLIEELELWRRYRLGEDLGVEFGAGFILAGPPGTGKTSIAKLIGEVLGGTFRNELAGSLESSYHGATAENISELFEIPKDEFRVITIDEIDGLLIQRNNVTVYKSSIVSHFLGVVSGAPRTHPNYLLIGTTNDASRIDPAVLRSSRLGKIFTIDRPDSQARKAIFQNKLSGVEIEFSENIATLEELAARLARSSETANLSGDQIGEFANSLKVKAINTTENLTSEGVFKLFLKWCHLPIDLLNDEDVGLR